VTTAKDAVKMEDFAAAADIAVAEMDMSIQESAAWEAFLDGILPRRKQDKEWEAR
jgi:tetraacyldisaccharide-1-P 4'-kinase